MAAPETIEATEATEATGAGDPRPTAAGGWLNWTAAAAACGERVRGRPTHPKTVSRWAREGLQGVLLRSLYRGGSVVTRQEWLDEFFEGVTAAKREANARRRPGAAIRETPSAMSRRAAKGIEAAKRAGIL